MAESTTAKPEVLECEALGRIAHLGDLYDARTDKFWPISLFKKPIPSSALTCTGDDFNEVTFTSTDTLKEKFSKLGIGGGLSGSAQLQTMLGVSGSSGGGYFGSAKDSAKVKSHCTHAAVITAVERLELNNDDVKEIVSKDIANWGIGTHIVNRIYWGGTARISVETTKQNKKTESTWSGKTSMNVNASTASTNGTIPSMTSENKYTFQEVEFELSNNVLDGRNSGGKYGALASAEKSEEDAKASENAKLTISGDFLPTGENHIALTHEEASGLMKRLPTLVQQANNGKGKPVKYTLFPLSDDTLKKLFEIKDEPPNFKTISESIVARIVSSMDNIAMVHQELNDFVTDVKDYRYCLDHSTVEQINDFQVDLEVALRELKISLAQKARSVRCGFEEDTELYKVITNFQTSQFAIFRIQHKLEEDYSTVRMKIDFAKLCAARNVQYIGRNKRIESYLAHSAEVYVLYGDAALLTKSSQNWAYTEYLFFRIQENRCRQLMSDAVPAFLYVDCDIVDVKEHRGKIEHYMHAACICTDVVLVEKELTKKNVATCKRLSGYGVGLAKEDETITFEAPCPRAFRSGRCERRPRTWQCKECENTLKCFEKNDHLYLRCLCGWAYIRAFGFRCCSHFHDLLDFEGFEKHECQQIRQQLFPVA